VIETVGGRLPADDTLTTVVAGAGEGVPEVSRTMRDAVYVPGDPYT